MNVFIYIRTHINDPCECGTFGVCDCMGSFRNYNYDAVLGIGGKSPWKGCENIAQRLTWVGICPHKKDPPAGKTCSETKKRFRGPLVTFEHFCLMNEKGPLLSECAPWLNDHLFPEGKHRRYIMSKNLSDQKIRYEIEGLMKEYHNCPSSGDGCKCAQS